MFAADFGVGQVLWSILWFFLFFMWIWLVISIFADIIRSGDLSGWGKALWSILIIFLPFLGVFLYLIVRGGKMAQHSAEDAQDQQAAVNAYIRQAAGTAGPGDQLATLAELHNSGKLSDAEYAQAKARVLGS
jgi:type VI protein secretion system component VasK